MLPNQLSRAGCAGRLFAAVWIGGWTLGTLFFDGFLAWGVGQQLLALTWPETAGIVTRSTVQVDSDSEGTSYQPDVAYRYVVNGTEHTGDSVTLVSISSGRTWAERTVARYPTGRQVRVRYNPRRPSWAVLEPGIGPMEAFLALFLTPFNIVMLGSWSYVWNAATPATRPGLPPGAKRRDDYEGFRLKLYETRPIAMAAAMLLGVSFAGVFFNIFLVWLAPDWPLVYGLWLVALGLAAYAYFRQRGRATQLRINTLRGIFQIDRPGGAATRGGSLSDLHGVQVRTRTRKDSEGDMQTSYAVVVRHEAKGQPSRTRLLVRNWSENDATRLARWLSNELRIPLLNDDHKREVEAHAEPGILGKAQQELRPANHEW